ncbi:MAG: transposase [Symploca sp. SIO2D2]|nr:transposase [Symploca sp. SIO2D2]
MKAYSLDLRQKVVEAYNNKEGSYRKLAKRFRVSLTFVKTLLKRYQQTGSIEPRPHAGGQAPKLKAEQLVIINELVTNNNDAILSDLCDQCYQKTQIAISRATMSRMLQKLNLTRKKNFSRYSS